MRSKYNINIVATKYGDRITPVTNPDYVFNRAENILIMGQEDVVRKFLR